MKQYVYDFYGENELEEVIDRFRQERREKAGLFITLYHESNDLEKVKESIQTLRKAFPQSAIAGMSASGGIKDGRMVLGKSVVAFLSFEDTEVSVHCYDISSMTPGEAGERALESFSGIRNLAGVEVFTTLSTVDVDDFLTELDHLPPETAIFGGGADAYTGGDDTCVFGNDFISRKAIVAVCFAGKVKIRVSQNLGWQPLGQVMTITATDGDKVIRELDGRPAFQVYEKYLKMKKSDFGGQQLISFPLLLMRKGRMLARLPAACRDDGSLIMSASCFEGEKVRLAYGDPNEIIARCQENTKQLRTFAPEGILIFPALPGVFPEGRCEPGAGPLWSPGACMRRLFPRRNQPLRRQDIGPQHDPGGCCFQGKRGKRDEAGRKVFGRHRFLYGNHDHHTASGLLHSQIYGRTGAGKPPSGGSESETGLRGDP